MSNVRGSGRGKQVPQDNLMNMNAQFQLPLVQTPHSEFRGEYNVPPPHNGPNYTYRFANQQFPAPFTPYTGFPRQEFSQQPVIYPQYSGFPHHYSQDTPPYQHNAQSAPVASNPPSRSKKILSFINPDSQAPVELPTRQEKGPATNLNTLDAERKTQTNREFMDKVKKELNNKESSPNKPELAAEIAQAVVDDHKDLEELLPSCEISNTVQTADSAEVKNISQKEENEVSSIGVQIITPIEKETTNAPEEDLLDKSETPPLVKEESKGLESEDKFDEKIGSREASPSQDNLTENAPEKTPEEIAKEQADRIAEEAEKKRLKEIELDSAIVTLLNGTEVDPKKGLYSRAFMVTVRDIEREFKRTPCPLSPSELAEFNLDIKTMRVSERKTNFNPPWVQSNKQRPNNPYRGRTTTDGTGRGASRHERGVNKKPPVVRQSIERIQRVSLPTTKNGWKPTRQLKDEDISEEEAKIRDVCKKVRSLMNKITPTSKTELIEEFINLQVSSNDIQLVQVVNIIFDKAVEEPKFCSLYAELCRRQVEHEVKNCEKQKSPFRNKILTRAQLTFQDRTLEVGLEKAKEMEAETDPVKKEKMKAEILEQKQKFRRRKFGNMTFMGHLYRNGLLSLTIVRACVFELLSTVAPKDNTILKKELIDEESVHCALQLFETIGTTLDAKDKTFLDQWLLKLELAKSCCTNKIRFMIMNLIELRKNRWVPRKSAETGPKKLEDIQKEVRQEQIEKAARDQYDRRPGGIRTNSNSLKKQAPVARNSMERKNFQQPDQKRAAAAANTKLTSSNVQPKNITLSQMNDISLVKSKKEWHSGASGGGMSTSAESSKAWGRRDSNDTRKKSMADDKQAALAAVREMGANELARKSISQTSISDKAKEEELSEEQLASRGKLMYMINSDIKEIMTGVTDKKEVVENFFEVVNKEKYAFPSVTSIYEMAVRSASTCVMTPDEGKLLGQILGLTLTDKAKKQAFIDGAVKFCKHAVDNELWYDIPNIWSITGEVLMNASHMPQNMRTGVEVLCFEDLTPVFQAGKTDQHGKKFSLFIEVFRRLAEVAIEEFGTAEGALWDYQDLKIRGEMEKEGLLDEMAKCQLKNGDSLKNVLGV